MSSHGCNIGAWGQIKKIDRSETRGILMAEHNQGNSIHLAGDGPFYQFLIWRHIWRSSANADLPSDTFLGQENKQHMFNGCCRINFEFNLVVAHTILVLVSLYIFKNKYYISLFCS